MLDPRRVLTFREVARLGSFSRAAEALALSQPAVSQQVAALEHELGTTLLVRGRTGAVPTPPGKLLLQHAEALAARLELTDSQMDEVVTTERRALRMGAFPSAMATIVPDAIARLRGDDPALELTVEEGTLDELSAGVEAGSLHAAVCFQDAGAPRREHEGLDRVDLGEEPMVTLLPADHRLARKRAVSLRELADEAWMAPSRDGIVVRACRAEGFEPRLVILTRDPLAACALAAAGLAVSLTPQLLTRLELSGVATPPLRGEPPRRSLYLLLPAAGAHRLADSLAQALGAALSSS